MNGISENCEAVDVHPVLGMSAVMAAPGKSRELSFLCRGFPVGWMTGQISRSVLSSRYFRPRDVVIGVCETVTCGVIDREQVRRDSVGEVSRSYLGATRRRS